MNLTPEQSRLLAEGRMLPIMETFYSIQGEGANTGVAAFFVRIGGCDVGCYWCDVKESWNPDLHPLLPVDDVINLALLHPARSVVITGGEPLLYNLEYLCTQFENAGFQLFLETSGSSPFSGSFDWICLSPKKKAAPLTDVLIRADELKVIVFEDSDFEWAESLTSDLKKDCLLLLQPEWSRREKMMPAIVDYILANPKWMISLQSHKYMKIP